MADPVPNAASAEDRQKRISEKTSFGKYIGKQLYETVVVLGSIGAGAAAFWAAAKNARVAKIAEKAAEGLGSAMHAPEGALKKHSRAVFATIGGAAGSVVAGNVLNYGHWKNVEGEKLAVGEINQDVGNLVEQRAKFADTLNRQETLIKDLIAQREAKGGSAVERTAASAEPTPLTRG